MVSLAASIECNIGAELFWGLEVDLPRLPEVTYPDLLVTCLETRVELSTLVSKGRTLFEGRKSSSLSSERTSQKIDQKSAEEKKIITISNHHKKSLILLTVQNLRLGVSLF